MCCEQVFTVVQYNMPKVLTTKSKQKRLLWRHVWEDNIEMTFRRLGCDVDPKELLSY
jgi:hypothetical protein